MPRLCRGKTARGRKEKRAACPAFAMAKQRRGARKSGRRPAFAVAKQHRDARKSGWYAPPLPWRNSAGGTRKSGRRPAFAIAKQPQERKEKRAAHPAFSVAKQRRGREEKIRADAFSPPAGRFRAALLSEKRHGRDEKAEKKRLFFQKCAIIFSKTLDFRKNYAIIDKDRIDEYEEWLASHSSFHVRAHDAPPLYAKIEFPRRRIHEKRNQRHRA